LSADRGLDFAAEKLDWTASSERLADECKRNPVYKQAFFTW